MSAERPQFQSRFARGWATVLVVLSIGWGFGGLVSCSNNPPVPSDAKLRAQAAQATVRAKQQSKEALQDARVAAANAERKVNAIAAGVREGIRSDQGAKSNPAVKGAQLDINRASDAELASLPGISLAKARQIEKHRPYTSTRQLVDRGLLTRPEFDSISSELTVR